MAVQLYLDSSSYLKSRFDNIISAQILQQKQRLMLQVHCWISTDSDPSNYFWSLYKYQRFRGDVVRTAILSIVTPCRLVGKYQGIGLALALQSFILKTEAAYAFRNLSIFLQN
jgi:hypothetical protein